MKDEFSYMRGKTAFSLIELLVVMAVIGIIAAFAVPAANTMLRGTQMTQATQMLVDQMSLARQQAISRSRSIEVRFYRYADNEVPGETAGDSTTGKFRAVQLFEILNNGSAVPIDKVQALPSSIIYSYSGSPDGLSSILESSATVLRKPTPQDPLLARGIENHYDFVSFRFLPDGSTNLVATQTWCVTLIGLNDRLEAANTPPANFFTLQLDPVNGSGRGFRPTVR